MIVFPNCKINIGLIITGKRADGYHDIQTIFYPLPIKDALEIIVVKDGQKKADNEVTSAEDLQQQISFTSSGISIAGSLADNICVKAYHLLKNDFPLLPPIQIHLHKAIPVGAGLGGGSADGAFVLNAVNEKFKLGLSARQLISYALQLGSDCPFFIVNEPSLGTGRGEILTPIALDLSPFQLILVNPGIHVNTGWAFSQLEATATDTIHKNQQQNSITGIISLPVEKWKDNLVNIFERPVFNKYPEIKSVQESMYAKDAVYASMSGSGSSVYGLFYKNVKPRFSFPGNYFLRQILL